MSAPVSPGHVLAGKYLVERILGTGGMGVVVAARHMQLDERVAIKLLSPESLNKPGVVARFLREGRLSAKIRSDHVARVRDVGTLESGAPYLVLEFLDGTDLNELVKAHGPLPVEIAVEYILQACEAIAEAHSLGIIHRDLKPANLFLTTRPDGSPCVKLIDFGISKLVGGGGAGLDLTKTLEMRGSPHFMSPEQIMAAPDIDTRSDLWALGVTLHNLLTGGHAFPATQITELCVKILQGSPVSLRAARPGAPEALEAVILRCLQKAPQDRYPSVAELAAALAPFAPPPARISADRISRIMRSAGAASDAPEERAMPLSSTGTPSPGAVQVSSGSPGQREDAGERTIMGVSTWSITGTLSSPRGRSLVVVAAAASMIGAVAAIALLKREPDETAQRSRNAATLGPEARPEEALVVAPAQPSVSGAPAPQPEATEAASAASSAPTPAAAQAAPASPKAAGSVAPAPGSTSASPRVIRPSTRRRTEKDLFNTSL